MDDDRKNLITSLCTLRSIAGYLIGEIKKKCKIAPLDPVRRDEIIRKHIRSAKIHNVNYGELVQPLFITLHDLNIQIEEEVAAES